MIEVPRCRGYGKVPELLRDDPDVHALGPQLSRVGVAESMGMNSLVDARFPSQVWQQPADVGAGDLLPAGRAEERSGRAVPKRRPRRHPLRDDRHRSGVHPHRPRQPALAKEHPDHSVRGVYVLWAKL